MAKADQVIPDKVLEEGLLSHDTYVGAALLSGGKIQVVRKKREELAKGSMALLQTTQTKYKNQKKIFFCGEAAKGYKPEDMQPFVLLKDDKGAPTLVAFITGNFDPVESDFSEVFNAVQDKLEPHVLGLFEKDNNDITKLMARLKLKHMDKEFTGLIGKSSVSICLASSTADIVTFSSNPNAAAQAWGWTSGEVPPHVEAKDDDDLFATGEAGAIPEVVEPKKDDDDLFEGDAKPNDGQHKTDVKPAALNKKLPPHLQAAADKKAALANGSAKEEKPVTEATKKVEQLFQGKPVKEGFEVVTFTVEQMKDQKIKQQVIINRCGNLFKGWREAKEFLAPMKNKPARSLQELGDKLKSGTTAQAPEPDTKTTTEATPKADPASTPQPDVVEPGHKPPVIPAKHLPQLEQVLAKMPAHAFMDVHGDEITNPDVLPSLDSKYPDFALALGLPGMAATIPWSFDDYERIGSNSLPALTRCALDTKVAWVKNLQEIHSLRKRLEAWEGKKGAHKKVA